MSERQEHAYAITLGLTEEKQGTVTMEDLTVCMESIARQLKRRSKEKGWSFFMEWVVSDASASKARQLRAYRKSPHVHIALVACPGDAAVDLIKRYWQRKNLGILWGARQTVQVKPIRDAGWHKYMVENAELSTAKIHRKRCSDNYKGMSLDKILLPHMYV